MTRNSEQLKKRRLVDKAFANQRLESFGAEPDQKGKKKREDEDCD